MNVIFAIVRPSCLRVKTRLRVKKEVATVLPPATLTAI
jgi:hypothetical protein